MASANYSYARLFRRQFCHIRQRLQSAFLELICNLSSGCNRGLFACSHIRFAAFLPNTAQLGMIEVLGAERLAK